VYLLESKEFLGMGGELCGAGIVGMLE